MSKPDKLARDLTSKELKALISNAVTTGTIATLILWTCLTVILLIAFAILKH